MARPRAETRCVTLWIGTSGWQYGHWRGKLYERGLPMSRWFDRYVESFDTVELNVTFYRQPKPAVFEGWARRAPEGFLFAVKASRFLTHMKRLRDPDEPLERLFSRAAALGPRLGPVLYQLPGQFHVDRGRLEAFLQALPTRLTPRGRRLQHVIEFRHPSWYTPEIYNLLEHHDVALCLHDKADSTIERPWVGPFSYVRFHGTSGHYHGSYSDAHLRRWARRLADQWRAGSDVYAYFNNDPDATATRNALSLRAMLDRVLQTRTG
jgi:uncharacterized protein YecE (DUF72 family)